MSSSSQKFIRRNRAPRVQIEYEVEVYGAQKKVELPFVMGVMADLAGAQETPPPKLEDRKFLEFDHDNFNSRMKAMKPRIATSMKNRLTGEGSLPLELTFESMDDFSPGAIAKRIEPLRKLLEARSRLSNLVAYMDGRGEAEALLSELLQHPERLREQVESLASRASHADDARDPDDGDRT